MGKPYPVVIENEKWNSLRIERKNEILDYLTTWLNAYTDEVVKKVLANINDILEDKHTMRMLKELYEREKLEEKYFRYDIENMVKDYNNFSIYKMRTNALTHSESYRNVLYDMYIRDIKLDEIEPDNNAAKHK